jgi:hypothetical protein
MTFEFWWDEIHELCSSHGIPVTVHVGDREGGVVEAYAQRTDTRSALGFAYAKSPEDALRKLHARIAFADVDLTTDEPADIL